MQTRLTDAVRATAEGREAEAILRKCTHCGFCLATCPTYQLLGDELDSPRGRIYLVKQLLEGDSPGPVTRRHLDRCLTCRACETTCPSGVEYGRLADLGREIVERQGPPRPVRERATRWLLRHIAPRPGLFAGLMRAGQALRPLLPAALRDHVPVRRPATGWPQARGRDRRVVVVEGCVQPAMAPPINPETARVLAELGIDPVRVPEAGCCGAMAQHLGHPEEARERARRNIDAWWPHVAGGCEAILVNASGCGAVVKEYHRLLAGDPDYAERAAQVAALARDPVELLEGEDLAPRPGVPRRIAFQEPCSLQHGQRLAGRSEALLRAAGFELTPVAEAHLCCGSAGTYSVLQPELAGRLRDRKLAGLTAGEPELIATANIGCLTHLQAATELPVRHWIELVTAAGT